MAIFALLTGVSNYKQKSIQPLTGAAKDVDKMAVWLNSQFGENEVRLVKLVNEEATKTAIVDAFETFLSQAGHDDQVLFYFSGHGALETMPASLERFEPGACLKTLVCYDSLQDASLLADKELRWLIYERSLTCKNILVVMDCCHSGYATRGDDRVRKSLPGIIPAREWSAFIFPEGTAGLITEALDLAEVLPEGAHLHMAACESRQSAWEVRGTSIFTANLLQVLEKTNGNISYNNLYNRVKYLIANRYDQVPVISVAGANMQEYISRLFLGGVTSKYNGVNANVVFNRTINAWIADKGGIHGLHEITGNYDLPVLTEPGAAAFTWARIKNILPDHSIVEMKDTADTQVGYYTTIKALYYQPLNILPQGENEGVAVLENFFSANHSLYEREGICFSKNIEAAVCNYIVIAGNGSYWLMRPDEYFSGKKLIPLIKGINGYTDTSARELFNALMLVARWEFARNLHNEHTQIKPFPLRLQLIYLNPEGKLTLSQADDSCNIKIKYPQDDKGIHLPAKLKLINISDSAYYSAVVSLHPDFSIDTSWLPGDVDYIDKDKTKLLNDGKAVDFLQSPAATYFNLQEESCYFLIIASTERFGISSLQQQGLPSPVMSAARGEAPAERVPRSRGTITLKDWTTKLIRVQFMNPNCIEQPEQPVTSNL